MPKIFGYARCSTNENKQDIDRQARELKNIGVSKIYKEYASGTAKERPQLEALQEIIKSGDTLVATELSRLTRSVHHLCHLLEWAAHRQAVIKVGGFTADFSAEVDPMVEGMLLMMGTFAQIEQKTTVQRVKSGVANARAKGKRLGRPPLSKDKIPAEFFKHYPRYLENKISKAEFARLCECSRPTLYRYLALTTANQPQKDY